MPIESIDARIDDSRRKWSKVRVRGWDKQDWQIHDQGKKSRRQDYFNSLAEKQLVASTRISRNVEVGCSNDAVQKKKRRE